MQRITTVQVGGKEFPFGPLVCTCDEFVNGRKMQQAERRRQEEAQQRVLRIEELFRSSSLPERWRVRTFGQFHVTEQNRRAFETAREYAMHFVPTDGNGLLFSGTVGTGKTHLVAAITMELISREYRVVFGTVTSLLAQVRNTFDSDRMSEADVMRRLTSCDLLVIDDIGKEKVTPWVAQTMYEIINTRYERNKSLIITTNLLDINDLRSRYNVDEFRKKDGYDELIAGNVGDAIVDRLLGMCRGVRLNGESWRKKGY